MSDVVFFVNSFDEGLVDFKLSDRRLDVVVWSGPLCVQRQKIDWTTHRLS